MSYLQEVLSSADEMEIEDIKKKIPFLISEVNSAHHDLKKYVENVYIKFTEHPMHKKSFFEKVKNLANELRKLKGSIDVFVSKGMCGAKKDLEHLNKSICEIDDILEFDTKILSVHECLRRIKYLKQDNLYCDTIEEINKGISVMSTVREEKKWNFEYQSLDKMLKDEEAQFYSAVTAVIESNIEISENDNRSALKIKRENNLMQQALFGLFAYDWSTSHIQYVAKFLWEYIFVPIVDYSSEVQVSKENSDTVLTVIIRNKSTKSNYEEVFNRLETVIDFLQETLGHYKIKENHTILEYMGEDFRDNLSELIIKHCLQNTIPNTKEELEAYGSVIGQVEIIQEKLSEAGIFVEQTNSLVDYTNNVGELFINKRCESFVNSAIAIMKKDLHNMVEVGKEFDINSPMSEISFNEFSRCSVSKSTLLLLELIENILKESLTNKDFSSSKLFKTVQKILLMYVSFVPEYHQKLLQTIPQQIALFHNNCLYLTHKLTEWNEKYSKQVDEVLQVQPPAFKTEPAQFKVIALEMFNSFIESQQQQIIDILKDSGLNTIQTSDSLNPSVEKCIRQCLRQQELLKTAWQKVLSYSVYNKTFGHLLACLCEHLINGVLQAEDISSNVAEQLVECFKVILARGPKLFIDPKEVTLYVNNWYKFNELIFILGSGLIGICDRWADGKGPLAMHFKPEEVRKLIRALFQNTDRRANALSMIV